MPETTSLIPNTTYNKAVLWPFSSEMNKNNCDVLGPLSVTPLLLEGFFFL